MNREEAEAEAIRLGALEPQGAFEIMQANWIENASTEKWRDKPKARQRLALWTEAVLAGRNPKRTVG
jgi:hypothetical protein